MAFARPVFAPVFFAAFFAPVDFALVAIGLSPRCRRSVETACCGLDVIRPLCTGRPACSVQAHKAVPENGRGKSSSVSAFLASRRGTCSGDLQVGAAGRGGGASAPSQVAAVNRTLRQTGQRLRLPCWTPFMRGG